MGILLTHITGTTGISLMMINLAVIIRLFGLFGPIVQLKLSFIATSASKLLWYIIIISYAVGCTHIYVVGCYSKMQSIKRVFIHAVNALRLTVKSYVFAVRYGDFMIEYLLTYQHEDFMIILPNIYEPGLCSWPTFSQQSSRWNKNLKSINSSWPII